MFGLSGLKCGVFVMLLISLSFFLLYTLLFPVGELLWAAMGLGFCVLLMGTLTCDQKELGVEPLTQWFMDDLTNYTNP